MDRFICFVCICSEIPSISNTCVYRTLFFPGELHRVQQIEQTGTDRRVVVVRARHLVPDVRDAVLLKQLMVALREFADDAVRSTTADDHLLGNLRAFRDTDLILLQRARVRHVHVHARHKTRRRRDRAHVAEPVGILQKCVKRLTAAHGKTCDGRSIASRDRRVRRVDVRDQAVHQLLREAVIRNHRLAGKPGSLHRLIGRREHRRTHEDKLLAQTVRDHIADQRRNLVARVTGEGILVAEDTVQQVDDRILLLLGVSRRKHHGIPALTSAVFRIVCAVDK